MFPSSFLSLSHSFSIPLSLSRPRPALSLSPLPPAGHSRAATLPDVHSALISLARSPARRIQAACLCLPFPRQSLIDVACRSSSMFEKSLSAFLYTFLYFLTRCVTFEKKKKKRGEARVSTTWVRVRIMKILRMN